MVLSSQSYVFDPRPDFPLVTTAKRFILSEEGLTLVFAHGNGFHKEQWEPTIEDLTKLLGSHHVKIREIWALDGSNQGDAAILNERALMWAYEPIFRWEDNARLIHAFLSGLGTGVDVDFRKHRIIGIGHSMGANSLIMSTTFHPKVHYEAIIAVELMTMNQTAARSGGFLAEGSKNRRDTWASREEAYQSLKARKAWKNWDDRVLRIYTEYGLRPLPTLTYPDASGVTLKCTRAQETATYRDQAGLARVYNILGAVAKRTPLHMIYGAIDDYVPSEVKEDVLAVAIGGTENLAGGVVRRVEGAGHLVNPAGVAKEMYECLKWQITNATEHAKL